MFRDGGGQRQGVQRAAHVPLQGVVDHLVLLHPRLARELPGHDAGGVMVTVAGKVGDGDLGIGEAGLDEPLDLLRVHGHREKTLPAFGLKGKGSSIAGRVPPSQRWHEPETWRGRSGTYRAHAALKGALMRSKPGRIALERCENAKVARAARKKRQRSAAGIQVGFMLVMTQAPPKAMSPAQTICGSMPMSAVAKPTMAPTTACTA